MKDYETTYVTYHGAPENVALYIGAVDAWHSANRPEKTSHYVPTKAPSPEPDPKSYGVVVEEEVRPGALIIATQGEVILQTPEKTVRAWPRRPILGSRTPFFE